MARTALVLAVAAMVLASGAQALKEPKSLEMPSFAPAVETFVGDLKTKGEAVVSGVRAAVSGLRLKDKKAPKVSGRRLLQDDMMEVDLESILAPAVEMIEELVEEVVELVDPAVTAMDWPAPADEDSYMMMP